MHRELLILLGLQLWSVDGQYQVCTEFGVYDIKESQQDTISHCHCFVLFLQARGNKTKTSKYQPREYLLL